MEVAKCRLEDLRTKNRQVEMGRGKRSGEGKSAGRKYVHFKEYLLRRTLQEV